MATAALETLNATCSGRGQRRLVARHWTRIAEHPITSVSLKVSSAIPIRIKRKLTEIVPEITGTISVNFLFILIGIAELTFSETLVMGCSAILVQCLATKRRWPRPEQVAFNVSSAAVAIAAAYYVYHGPVDTRLHPNAA